MSHETQTLSRADLDAFIVANAEGLTVEEETALAAISEPGDSADISVHAGWLTVRLATAVAYTPRHTFGIPYARGEIVKVPKGLAEALVCPECGDTIICIEAKDFESFTHSEYSDHYDRHHNPAVLSVEGFTVTRVDDCVSLRRDLPDGFALVLTNVDGEAIPQEGEAVHLIVLDAIEYMESEGEVPIATLGARLDALVAEHAAETG